MSAVGVKGKSSGPSARAARRVLVATATCRSCRAPAAGIANPRIGSIESPSAVRRSDRRHCDGNTNGRDGAGPANSGTSCGNKLEDRHLAWRLTSGADPCPQRRDRGVLVLPTLGDGPWLGQGWSGCRPCVVCGRSVQRDAPSSKGHGQRAEDGCASVVRRRWRSAGRLVRRISSERLACCWPIGRARQCTRIPPHERRRGGRRPRSLLRQA